MFCRIMFTRPIQRWGGSLHKVLLARAPFAILYRPADLSPMTCYYVYSYVYNWVVIVLFSTFAGEIIVCFESIGLKISLCGKAIGLVMESYGVYQMAQYKIKLYFELLFTERS